MIALSIRQPWAWATVFGPKRVENRSRRAPSKHVGTRIALHASLGFDREGERAILDFIAPEFDMPAKDGFPRGVIMGTAVLACCLPKQDSSVANDPWAFGPWCYVWEDVRPLVDLIPCKGRLGFWTVPADVAARIAP